ncbi:transporter [Lithospermum erythrorhizon]|uniref:Transporter n=1 Tax=Lithospermum erythrorhizon TaxID=34254 RepID=A0AAV3QW85_LITER
MVSSVINEYSYDEKNVNEKSKIKIESESKNAGVMKKLLLGLGFWVQGFRCFPWMGVIFYLKDGLRVDPSTIQILQNSANLPMIAKPFYGIVSDSFYIFGQHRIPYIAIGAFLQAVAWISIALSSTSVSFFTITMFLLLGNLGASIVEVANDAIVAETGTSKNFKSSSAGELQSFVWMAGSIGGVVGNLVGGIAIDKFSPKLMFFAYGVLLSIQFLITVCVHESSLHLPSCSANNGIRKQLSELLAALSKPEIFYSIAWLAISYAAIPSLTGTMFFYQTQQLYIESSVLGLSKVVGQAAMLLWGIVYNQRLKKVPSRKLLSAIQVVMAIFMLSDFLFVKGVYRMMGLPDSLYVVVVSGVLEILIFFKILPFTVMMSKLCPLGCEGSLMAFLTSVIALAMMVSGYLGVALASYVQVTGNNFSGLPYGLVIQAACTLLPLIWTSWVHDDKEPHTKSKEN